MRSFLEDVSCGAVVKNDDAMSTLLVLSCCSHEDVICYGDLLVLGSWDTVLRGSFFLELPSV